MADENPVFAALRRVFGGGPATNIISEIKKRGDDPASHQLFEQYLVAYENSWSNKLDLKSTETGQKILALNEKGALRLLFAASAVSLGNRPRPVSLGASAGIGIFTQFFISKKLVGALLRRRLPFDQDDLTVLLTAALGEDSELWISRRALLRIVADWKEEKIEFTSQLRGALSNLRASLAKRRNSQNKVDLATVEDLLRQGDAPPVPLNLSAGESWSDAALSDLAEMTAQERNKWTDLLRYPQTADGSKPSGKWLAGGAEKVGALGQEEFCRRVSMWMPLIAKPRTQTLPPPGPYQADRNHLIVDAHADILKGLAWCCSPIDDVRLARALGDAGVAAYKKVPLHGPRCIKLANAIVLALSSMPGNEAMAQLGRVNAQVKHPSARKLVAKRINDVAARTGQTAADLAELALPTFDLDANGLLQRDVADFKAEIAITGSTDAKLRLFRPDGKPQKSIPAELKRDHAQTIKDLQRTCKDIQKMLPAQRTRIERLLMGERQWPAATWKARYLDHPLVSNLSRRLIWEFQSGSQWTAGAWHKGAVIGSEDQPVMLDAQTEVRLWHPIRSRPDSVLGWRNWLEGHEITQPFKQAHREIYVLTAAEEQTRTYSNRFAGHILRQHQFAALCQARGWEYRLQGDFDSHNSPTLRLPDHHLRVELWVEQTNENMTTGAGIYTHVATDQVRFFRDQDLEPMELAQIPPLLFSEILRDVDLFVGVASVGNDPNWQDAGQRPGYGAYWQTYSFGELAESAKTRKAVLERLIPRLKIAGRCSFTERFLVVRGDIRTYKIHLGSGNILMEPNDHYLCIVPSRGASDIFGGLLLPFEGDVTLSIIISKALLLAEDKKINDPSIIRQIGSL